MQHQRSILWGTSCKWEGLRYKILALATWSNGHSNSWQHWGCIHICLSFRVGFRHHLIQPAAQDLQEIDWKQQRWRPYLRIDCFLSSWLHATCCCRCSWWAWEQTGWDVQYRSHQCLLQWLPWEDDSILRCRLLSSRLNALRIQGRPPGEVIIGISGAWSSIWIYRDWICARLLFSGAPLSWSARSTLTLCRFSSFMLSGAQPSSVFGALFGWRNRFWASVRGTSLESRACECRRLQVLLPPLCLCRLSLSRRACPNSFLKLNKGLFKTANILNLGNHTILFLPNCSLKSIGPSSYIFFNVFPLRVTFFLEWRSLADEDLSF